MLATLIVLFPMVFSNNLLMSLVKWIANKSIGTTGLRMLLIVFSICGAIATSALTGNDIDFNKISDLGRMFFEATLLFAASHGSYIAIKRA